MEGGSVIVSRTDSLGDLVLTLPLATFLKWLGCKEVTFLIRREFFPLARLFEGIDQVISPEDFLKNKDLGKADAIIHVFPKFRLAYESLKKGIKERIGTSRRWYHLFFCNRLVPLSRKGSKLHEAQLNIKLVADLYSLPVPDLKEIFNMYRWKEPKVEIPILPGKPFFIVHPLSRGSAPRWSLKNFIDLTLHLRKRFKVLVTGSAEEGEILKKSGFFEKTGAMDLTGKLDIVQLFALIKESEGIVSNSTGPLHIAATLGKRAVGIYASRKPFHPSRWGPIGPNAVALTGRDSCFVRCSKEECSCIQMIKPDDVESVIL